MLLISIIMCLPGCSSNSTVPAQYHRDTLFIQDYSIKYLTNNEELTLINVLSDRNGYIQIYSSAGLLRPSGGKFLFPGKLVQDLHYKPLSDKKIAGMTICLDQLIYLDDSAVLSNAWAGKIYVKHNMTGAKILKAGNDFTFLVSDGRKIIFLNDTEVLWESEHSDKIKDIEFDNINNCFWILGEKMMSRFDPSVKTIESLLENSNVTCIAATKGKIYAGTHEGYFIIDGKSKKVESDIYNKLPCQDITVISEVNGALWFGSSKGAFKQTTDGRYDYYASQRWLPSDNVLDIAKGPANSVLVLTDKGLASIFFNEITLEQKAAFFEKQVRERHIRHGFNATISGMVNGDITSGSLEDSDNDGLWTSMYLAGQVFKYSVTRSDESLANIRESLDAMERLYTINPVPGFPSRSFERRGYKYEDKPWRRATDPEWDWKSTTSSDEAIGHIFAFGVIAELVDEPEIREKAIMLIDTLMSHIVKNDFYLIDWNGEPTLWGKWNPEYVNALDVMVGDRKLNSSNIIGMLQTAYHFTGKEKYRDAAFYLMREHGYLENMMRPMSEIGTAPESAGQWSRLLSEGWNHSDDEMYYCGYWGLYRYAFNDTLQAMYKKAILDHWEIERPEKEGLWNIMTALTGAAEFDLDNAIWYLQQYPLDLINWSVTNSHRKDIELIEPDFRGQTTTKVLPPDELPVSRHNANRFDLDRKGEGRSEYSAGDIWLLPYWMGRFLEVIREPTDKYPE